MSRMVWYGDNIISKMGAAQKIGLDQVMAQCVVTAKGKVRVRTATLQGSIRFTPSVRRGNGAQGRWGSFDVNYALWQEIGTSKMSAQPYLRPASDQHYPELGTRIRIAFGAIR